MEEYGQKGVDALSHIYASRGYREVFFDRALEGIAILGKDGHFWAVNPAFALMLGYAPYELVGKKFQHITAPEDVEGDEKSALAVYEGEIKTYDMVKTYIRKDGTRFRALLRVQRIPPEGDQEVFRHFVNAIQPAPMLTNMREVKTEGGSVALAPAPKLSDIWAANKNAVIILGIISLTVITLVLIIVLALVGRADLVPDAIKETVPRQGMIWSEVVTRWQI